MRIAIYSLTRDRLQYTKDCFASLRENAGMPFDHYVFDNGSTDGTQEWLMSELDERRLFAVCRFGTNQGISYGSNCCIDTMFNTPRAASFAFRDDEDLSDYSIIIKVDNDCYVRTPNILPQICAVADCTGSNCHRPNAAATAATAIAIGPSAAPSAANVAASPVVPNSGASARTP